MNKINDFIQSGILESYVLGTTTSEESREVEQMAAANAEVKAELDAISKAMEAYAQANAVAPNPTIKPFLLAFIDYTERMQNGEPASFPPIMNESTKTEDFDLWLNRADMQQPSNFDEYYAKIISYTPEMITAITWIKNIAPDEAHHDEHEKFLILEGTCDIIVEDKVYQMVAGDFFAVPLYKNHVIKVTSKIPCKVILQRMAA